MPAHTHKGDDGKTSLPGREPVWKHDEVIRSLGSLDELSSAIGLALAASAPDDISDALKNVQRLLFCLGAELACRAPASRIQTAHVEEIDTMLEGFNAQLQPLTRFILPGGSELASRLHLARAICRRAERDLAAYKQEEPDPVSPHALALMNRLSDLLFALARLANKRAGSAEEKWDAEQEREPPAK